MKEVRKKLRKTLSRRIVWRDGLSGGIGIERNSRNSRNRISVGRSVLGWRELLPAGAHREDRWPIGVLLAVLQQFCGINVIFNYAEDIYRAAGYGLSGVMLNIVATGAIGPLATTLIAFAMVDKFGSGDP